MLHSISMKTKWSSNTALKKTNCHVCDIPEGKEGKEKRVETHKKLKANILRR